MSSSRNITRRQFFRAAVITVQWLLLTVALGALVVYSSDTFEGYISPNLESGFMFFGAFIMAFLLGTSIESFKVLMPLAVLMCAGAAFIFIMVVFAPTFAEITVLTTQLQNYATTRAFLFTVLMFLPAVVGAGFGNLASGYLRDDVLADDRDARSASTSRSWHERRNDASSPVDADRNAG